MQHSEASDQDGRKEGPRTAAEMSLATDDFFENATRSPARHWLGIAAVSAVVLVPCFWHRQIAAGDLGSHVYNAWLCDLIRAGKAPGLWIADQWSNVLFDLLLDGLAQWFGFVTAEKLAVAIAVLVFFWGAVAFIRAINDRVTMWLFPVVAMVAYGWTFHSGFFNYYLAVGISFWALAIFQRVQTWRKSTALLFVPLAYLAHPLGAFWLVGAMLYLGVAQQLKGRGQMLLLALAAATLVGIRLYIRHERFFAIRQYFPAYLINGADQMVLGTHYYWIAVVLVLAGLAAVIPRLIRQLTTGGVKHRLGLPLQLYCITLFIVWTQPTVIYLPRFTSPVGFILERVSLISAVLGCCLLGGVELRRWPKLVLVGVATSFFALVHADTAALNRIETRVAELVQTIPPGQRVISTLATVEEGSRLQFNMHLVDRACVGRAFSFANYESATSQFRVRARAGNEIVMLSNEDIGATFTGNYVVRPGDLPIFQIEQRSADRMDLVIRPLAAGEKNGWLGFRSHP